MTFGCAKCDSRWGGFNTAHCGACHHTFTGVEAFDRHRRGGRCASPAESGLELDPDRAYACYRRARSGRAARILSDVPA
jgi:hypothetical protein